MGFLPQKYGVSPSNIFVGIQPIFDQITYSSVFAHIHLRPFETRSSHYLELRIQSYSVIFCVYSDRAEYHQIQPEYRGTTQLAITGRGLGRMSGHRGCVIEVHANIRQI